MSVEEQQHDFCLPIIRSIYGDRAVPRQFGKHIGRAVCLENKVMTVEIPLTQGYITIIDDEDDDLAQYKWTAFSQEGKTVYAYRAKMHNRERTEIRLHRAILSRILGRTLSRLEHVDHKDGNGLNNQRSNLRLATPLQNSQNQKRRKSNNSGFKGVSWDKTRNKWRSTIKVDGKQKHLGRFTTPELAYSAYCEASKKYFGEFARFE